MYGYADDPIAAQVQLYQYQQGADVGELDSLGGYLGQSNYGWGAELVTGLTSLVGGAVGVFGQHKGAQQQAALMRQEQELLEERGRILAQQAQIEEGKTQRMVMGIGFLTLAGGVGLVVWQWPKISKKLGL